MIEGLNGVHEKTGRATAAPSPSTELEAIRRELRAIRRMLKKMTSGLVVNVTVNQPARGEAPEPLPADASAPNRPAPAGQTFIPTPFQKGILRALEGRDRRARVLGLDVGDERRLFRHPGGIQELRERGLVDHHERLGYYRPDAPPPELASAASGQEPPPPRRHEERCDADILLTIREVGFRMTTTPLLSALEERGRLWGERTVKGVLADLVKAGKLTNRSDVRPTGYGLPEWEEA